MRITIRGESGIDMLPFISSYIIPLMQTYLRGHIDRKHLIHFQNEFDVHDFLSTIFRSNFLVCRKVRSDYIIEINTNLFMRNSFAKLVDICGLVNYGNVNCQSYPIFTQMFQYIRGEFFILYKMYYE